MFLDESTSAQGKNRFFFKSESRILDNYTMLELTYFNYLIIIANSFRKYQFKISCVIILVLNQKLKKITLYSKKQSKRCKSINK